MQNNETLYLNELRKQGVLRDLSDIPEEFHGKKVGLLTCKQHHIDIGCWLKGFHLSTSEFFSMPVFGGLQRVSPLHPDRPHPMIVEHHFEDALKHGVEHLLIGGHWPCANAQMHNHSIQRHFELFYEAMNFVGAKYTGKFKRIYTIMDIKRDDKHRTYVVDPISISNIAQISQLLQQAHAPNEARA